MQKSLQGVFFLSVFVSSILVEACLARARDGDAFIEFSNKVHAGVGLQADVRDDEVPALAKCVSHLRELRRLDARPNLDPNLLSELARVYANGVDPQLISSRVLSATSIKSMVIGMETVEGVPGKLEERMAIAVEMMKLSMKLDKSGEADHKADALRCAQAGVLLLSTDVPNAAFRIGGFPQEVVDTLKSVGLDGDQIRQWSKDAHEEMSKQRKSLKDELGSTFKSTSDARRAEKIDGETLIKFVRDTEVAWVAMQADYDMALLLAHGCFVMRAVASHSKDEQAMMELKNLSLRLSEKSDGPVQKAWAAQIFGLPMVPLTELDVPTIIEGPHDAKPEPK
jgi:hypothetical protein